MNLVPARWRVLAALAVGLFVAVTPAGIALADPAGPTDYSSQVVSIDPASPQIDVDIIGGDAFVSLTVQPGSAVTVYGYYGEPYLQILPDGTVQQNRRSPTVAQNQSRYGTSTPVEGTASDIADTLPEWETVGSGGSFVWHDHRAHWMSTSRPPGKGPGDTVVDDSIAMEVDGVPVSVRIVSTWMDPPSRVPLAAGALVAGFASLILLSVGKSQAWLLAAAGAAACGMGWWQFDSLPPASGPSTMWYILPGVAAASGVIALSFGRNLVAHALVLLGGLELAAWVYLRRDGMVRALLPTDAPFWLDRAVTAAAGVAAVAAVLAGGINLFRLPGPEPEPVKPTAKRSTGSKPKPKSKSKAKSVTASGANVTTWGRKGK